MSNRSGVIRSDIEVDSGIELLDPRTAGQKFWDTISYPWMIRATAAICLIWVFLMPGGFFLALFTLLFVWFAVWDKPDVLPIHLPFGAGKMDENNRRPGSGAPGKSEGGFYFGRIRSRGPKNRMEVWAGFKSVMQHILIFGTTGSGKTESIVSYLTGALSVGSGFIFNDAKAAPKAMVQIATILRVFGRDDDMRVINYITGGTGQKPDPAARLSNDLAAFARGTGESITQLLVALMPASGGDNKIFAERAIALASAILPALTDLRDQNMLQINPSVIREHMAFDKVMYLMRQDEITKKSRDALLGYLQSLPGYDDTKKPGEQPEEVTRQFGFAQAYFTRTLSSLSDTYGHIYQTGQGEVDWQDAVLHGRCIITLLPSLEKSGEELANLGKIVLTGIRNGMVVGLGTVFEGSTDDIAYNLPTNTEIPYFVFNDEVAYMLTDGMDIMNAQARGLGFVIGTGAQDVSGLVENISKTTKQVMANSAFKQIQYIDDQETTELAVGWSGEANVLVKGRYERYGDMGDHFATRDATVEKRPRLTSTAVKRLDTGQAYLMYKGEIHEVQIFNHGLAEEQKPDPKDCWVKHWFSVRMAKVHLPSAGDIQRLNSLDPRREYAETVMLLSPEQKAHVEALARYISSAAAFQSISGGGMSSKASEEHYSGGGLLAFIYERREKIKGLKGVEEVMVDMLEDESMDYAADAVKIVERQKAIELLGNETVTGVEDGLPEGFAESMAAQEQPAAAVVATTVESDAGESTDDLLAGIIPGFSEQEIEPAEVIASEVRVSSQAEIVSITEVEELPDLPEMGFADSGVANAVRENIGLMPWFDNSFETAEKAHHGMMQAELFVLDVPEEQARASADTGMALLVESSKYPKSKPPAASTIDLAGSLEQLLRIQKPI